jgi:hypothetical protein
VDLLASCLLQGFIAVLIEISLPLVEATFEHRRQAGDRINYPVIISPSLGRDCFGHLPHARAVVQHMSNCDLVFSIGHKFRPITATGVS